MSSTSASVSRHLARGGLARRFLVLALLVGLADFLFWGQNIGLSVATSVLCVGAGAALTHAGPRKPLRAAVAIFLAAAPSLAGFGLLSLGFAVFGSAYAVALLDDGTPWQQAGAALRLLRRIGWRLIPDAVGAAIQAEKQLPRLFNPVLLLGWLMPLTFGAVFLALFSSANPVIGEGLAKLNLWVLLDQFSWDRALFWMVAALFTWPFIAPHPPAHWAPFTSAKAPVSRSRELLFGRSAILRALILFNAMFAVQTALDITYLWLGRRLPDGLTYADYAHRGAYPLIFTALLAGLFAILATKPGTEASRSRLVQALVLGWIAQNVLLVLSSILRLDLYVQAYSLTELRLAALIRMLLVGAGLILIIARIVLKRSNLWLLQTNFLILAGTLYFCAFPNDANFIAMYDVKHCQAVAHSGPPLDFAYVEGLGPRAIPALDLYEKQTAAQPAAKGCIFPQSGAAGQLRQTLAAQFSYDPSDWRGWNFWDWDLAVYLAAHDVKCSKT